MIALKFGMLLLSCIVQVSASIVEGSSQFSSARLEVEGGYPLRGSVTIDGAKNSILPLMAVSLLTDAPLVLTNVPDITDVDFMLKLLRIIGVEYKKYRETRTLSLHFKGNVSTINSVLASDSNIQRLLILSERLRSSYHIMGSLVGRFGVGILANTGGCNLGPRPLNLHIDAMKGFGAIVEDGEKFKRILLPHKADGRGREAIEHTFAKISVGATINAILAAVMLSKRKTFLHNCSVAPEVLDVCSCLRKMGAKIEWRDRSVAITGVHLLQGTKHTVIPDRIEAGTYMIAAAATRGNLTVRNVENPYPLVGTLGNLLGKIGCVITYGKDYIQTACSAIHQIISTYTIRGRLIPHIHTQVYPGFPTDLQSPLLALLSGWEGIANIRVVENVFEDRFKIVHELRKMGAQIESVSSKEVVIMKGRKLHGERVLAQDLRSAAALCIAGLSADKGEVTIVKGIHHLDRGYTSFEKKLRSIGAKIERVLDNTEACRSWSPLVVVEKYQQC